MGLTVRPPNTWRNKRCDITRKWQVGKPCGLGLSMNYSAQLLTQTYTEMFRKEKYLKYSPSFFEARPVQ